MKKFDPELTVFVCPHVFAKERPILDVIRDFDGKWQFLCGHDFDAPDNGPKDGPQKIPVSKVLERDKSLTPMAELEVGHFAEREAENTDWVFGELE